MELTKLKLILLVQSEEKFSWNENRGSVLMENEISVKDYGLRGKCLSKYSHEMRIKSLNNLLAKKLLGCLTCRRKSSSLSGFKDLAKTICCRSIQ